MFKNIVSSLFALVAAPGKAWQSISSKEESQATFLNGYLYPIMGITALSVFVNLLNDQFTLEKALKLMTIDFVKFFVGFYIASFLIDELLQKFFDREKNPKQVQLFVGYTLSVYMLITIFLNLFMGMFSFLRFAPLYIMYSPKHKNCVPASKALLCLLAPFATHDILPNPGVNIVNILS